jgi:acyl-CoA synthetase (AMP-forming)/AMP-acid ligase II
LSSTVAEIKLVDAPKMGYTTDDEEGPAGEILVRGPNVSRGYLKLDDKTYAPPRQKMAVVRRERVPAHESSTRLVFRP